MTRYMNPESGKLLQAAHRIAKVDDGFPAGFGLAMFIPASLTLGVIFGIASSIFFYLLMLPGLFCIVMWILWGLNVKQLGSHAWSPDKMLEGCLSLYNKSKGTYAEQYARPLMRSVWNHALEGHKGGRGSNAYNYYIGCEPCTEREKLMRELIADNPIKNRDDIEQAKQFLQARKDIGA